jgi:hypothetical protein
MDVYRYFLIEGDLEKQLQGFAFVIVSLFGTVV